MDGISGSRLVAVHVVRLELESKFMSDNVKIHRMNNSTSMFQPGERVAYVEFDGSKEYGVVSSTNNKNVFVRFDRHVAKLGWDGATSQACDPKDLEKVVPAKAQQEEIKDIIL